MQVQKQGDPDFRGIIMASLARGRQLPVRSFVAPSLLEVFQPVLPLLLYPVCPEQGVPIRWGLPYLGKSLWRSGRPCPAARRPS